MSTSHIIQHVRIRNVTVKYFGSQLLVTPMAMLTPVKEVLGSEMLQYNTLLVY